MNMIGRSTLDIPGTLKLDHMGSTWDPHISHLFCQRALEEKVIEGGDDGLPTIQPSCCKLNGGLMHLLLGPWPSPAGVLGLCIRLPPAFAFGAISLRSHTSQRPPFLHEHGACEADQPQALLSRHAFHKDMQKTTSFDSSTLKFVAFALRIILCLFFCFQVM